MFNQYILILVWIAFAGILQNNFYRNEYDEVTGKYHWRINLGFAFIVMIPVIWMAANRGNVFGDTAMYRNDFRAMPSVFSAIPEYMLTVTKDSGFKYLSSVIKCVIGNQDIVYFFIIALVQASALVIVYRRYSCNYVLSVALFVLSTDYVAWMFNGIRQFLAVTMIFAMTRSILKKKYIRVLIVILLASTIHKSALIMIPIILISQGKAWNKKTLIFIILLLAAIMYLSEFTVVLDEVLSTTQYANVVSDYKSIQDDGTNPLRVLVYAMPTVLAFLCRKRIVQVGDNLIDFCINMSIISTGLYIISMFTSGIFIGRLPIYASLYGYILLPWEIEVLFADPTRKMIKICMIFAYLIFYYYQLHATWGLM